MQLHRFPIVIAGVVLLGGACSYALSVAITQVIAGACLPLQSASFPTPHFDEPTISMAAPPHGEGSAKAILSKNPFDSVTGPIVDVAPQNPTVDELDDDDEPRACAGGLRLVIAAVDRENPKRSIAVLATTPNGKPMVHPGSTLDGRRVRAIEGDRVYLEEGQRVCFVGTTIATAPPPSPKKPVVIETPSVIAGIARIDERHVDVDRLVRDRVLESPTDFMKTLRIAPEIASGKNVGVKLLSVQPGTLLAAIGLQPGDVVKSINGFDVTSPEKLLEAYATLKTAPQLQVGLMRGGADLQIEVNVK